MGALDGLKAMAKAPPMASPPEMGAMGEEEGESPRVMAAKDFLAAIKADDAEGLADAYEAMTAACSPGAEE